MNPSAAGWIIKLLFELKNQEVSMINMDEKEFYKQLKKTGFIYGNSVAPVLSLKTNKLSLTVEEFTKLNLLKSLLYIYSQFAITEDIQNAIPVILKFYKTLEKGKAGFLSKLSFTQSVEGNLEKVFSARLQETNSILKLNNVSVITFALLFIDVLAFKKFLEAPQDVKVYVETLEQLTIKTCFRALSSKKRKKKYDVLLIELFESTAAYLNSNGISEIAQNPFSHRTALEKTFFLDISCLAVWDDHEMDSSEVLFLKKLVTQLDISEEQMSQSILDVVSFSESSNRKMTLFNYSNPVKLFYKQSTATVKLLILRNKKRLTQELIESRELVKLLSLSTIRDLSTEEKVKVKDQLLDICKTVPSLAIFLLPGGTLLLPLLIKLIPKLLPSAFQDNRIDP